MATIVGHPVITLEVHVVPNAPRTEIVGKVGDRLKIKLHAPPADGKANAELIRFLAAALGLRRNQLAIVRGATARTKTIRIDPGDPAGLARAVAGLSAPGAPARK